MEERYVVTRTFLIDESSKPTGEQKYRIYDRTGVDSNYKHGEFESRPEADEICAKLNAEQK
ncbi:hypothetical protein [Pseudomonas putida]|uniref:hypothetical protein n=1 Tax=Pseudomonas putida TaxID=303 RepID=UPI000A5EBC09|nr:hypothetical protein [Pseudomonas putida]